MIQLVEGHYSTYATNTSQTALVKSRRHRAFGGFSMGGVTTWEVLASHSDLFYDYLPMAGEAWMGQSEQEVTRLLTKDLKRHHYRSQDFRSFASVGGMDATSGSMEPQILSLRKYQSQLMRKNLTYYIHPQGMHDLESLIAQMNHTYPRCSTKKNRR